MVLKELHLRCVGPAPQFDLELVDRLNLITGDNGLGKTFLLDIAWWALTGVWIGQSASPQRGTNIWPEIAYVPGQEADGEISPWTSHYDFGEQSWPRPPGALPEAAIVVYARVDGSFAVRDPARNGRGAESTRSSVRPGGHIIWTRSFVPSAYALNADELWNGLEEEGLVLCNGLIRDWVSWQNQPDQRADAPFQVLERVLRLLSHPAEPMIPGRPTRVSLEDVRDIPTLELPYGNVPVTVASAGMKRVLGLAYLLVWTWYEHTQAVKLLNQSPAARMVLLIDELEAHLHPRWQRTLLPAILAVAEALQQQIEIQVLATTHSPLVLASAEPDFDTGRDRLFLLQLQQGTVSLGEYPWAKQGDAVGWLTSDVFGLDQARSREAEQAIEAAEALMRGEDMANAPAHLRSRDDIQKELQRVLPGHDPFWPRWLVSTGQV